MFVRVALVGGILLLGGCFKSSLVTFPRARQVKGIEVSNALVPDGPPLYTITEPRKVEEILAFLHTQEGKWNNGKPVFSSGKYRLAFMGDNIRLFVRTGDGILQVQGADFEIHSHDLTPEEQDTLVALLSREEDPAGRHDLVGKE